VNKNVIYITIDQEWMPDPILEAVLEEIEKNRVAVTLFVTHKSPLLNTLVRLDWLELGIHPNLNDIPDGTVDFMRFVSHHLKDCRKMFPAATSIRSHSLMQSSRILDRMADAGFRHDLNTFIPATSNLFLKPWKHPGKQLIRVPYFFEDSFADRMDNGWNMITAYRQRGLRVFNFHPGRILLNIKDSNIPTTIQKHRNNFVRYLKHQRSANQTGSLKYLRQLIYHHQQHQGTFGLIRDIKLPGRSRGIGAGKLSIMSYGKPKKGVANAAYRFVS